LKKISKLLLLMGVSSLACWGSAILAAPDVSCDPTIDPPSSGGCTWENFIAHTDNTITAGSTFANHYIAAPDPLWTITTATYTFFRVLDGGHQGDTFTLFDNGNSVGSTSATPNDPNHPCGGVEDVNTYANPAACWNDPLMSRGVFLLAPGSHSLTVTWDQRVAGGDSTLQWFEIGVAPTPSVPEPSTVLLLGSGLTALGLTRLRIKRRG